MKEVPSPTVCESDRLRRISVSVVIQMVEVGIYISADRDKYVSAYHTHKTNNPRGMDLTWPTSE